MWNFHKPLPKNSAIPTIRRRLVNANTPTEKISDSGFGRLRGGIAVFGRLSPFSGGRARCSRNSRRHTDTLRAAEVVSYSHGDKEGSAAYGVAKRKERFHA